MKQRTTPHWLLLAVCGLLLLVTADKHAGAANPSRSFYSGYAQISGPMVLDLQISPPVSTPGDLITLVLTLTNNDKDRASPEVIITLPRSLRVDMTALPPGTSFNVAGHTLNWLPVVAADGGRQELRLTLPVETADLTEPQQQITAVLAHKTDEQTATADFWIGVEPEAGISLSTAQAAVGQPVQLTANVTGPGPLTQQWDLGDGRELAVANPVIVYPVVGTYRVALRATNPLATATATALITVVPRPVADFTVDDATPGVNEIVAFTSQSGGQRPLRYTWDFGDGTTDAVANPYHLYREPGEYTVRLLVENDAGQSETSQLVQVGLPPVAADMILSDIATSGEPIYGQVSGDETITAYRWNMGDGHSYEGGQVSHRYAVPGTYWVVASASNEFGTVDVGRWIRVRPGLSTMHAFLPVIRFTGLTPPEVSGSITGSTLTVDLPEIELAEPLVLDKMPFPERATAVEQLFWYINEARRLHNLPPLTYSETLSRAAQQHTDDMAGNRFTGHVGSDNSSPPGRLVASGYQGGYGGEATYWGVNNPRHAVEFWVNSGPHRRIILSQVVSEVGVAFTAEFNAPSVWYWTAEFGSPSLPAIVLTPTPIPSPTPTLTPTVTLAPTQLPTITPTAVTSTPLATATPTATPTTTPMPTYTPLPLVTPTATPEQ